MVVCGVEYCGDVQKWCGSRVGCGMALHNFFLGCDDNLSGIAHTCTQRCERALMSLLLSEDNAGLDFINCNCSGNSDCVDQKQKIEVCTRVVLQAIEELEKEDSVVSCTLAKMLCEGDSSCLAALSYYQDHCSSLFRGEKCTDKCNNSVSILYQQDEAKKLQTCKCDGTEAFNCNEVRYNTDRLCFNKHVTYTSSEGVNRSASPVCISPLSLIALIIVTVQQLLRYFVLWDSHR